MSNEKPEPESPWGKVAQQETKLKPEEVAQVRERAAADQVKNERWTELRRVFTEIATPVIEWARQGPEKRREVLREMIEQHNGIMREEFHVDSLGQIQLTEAQRSDIRVLLGAIRPSVIHLGKVPYFMPDDIRHAAAELTEAYPEITVEFQEDRTKGVFSYTAKLISSGK